MGVTLRSVEIETGSPDHKGLLVFDGECLLAILVQLSAVHGDLVEHWHLEYHPSFSKHPETFESLAHAVGWIDENVSHPA